MGGLNSTIVRSPWLKVTVSVCWFAMVIVGSFRNRDRPNIASPARSCLCTPRSELLRAGLVRHRVPRRNLLCPRVVEPCLCVRGGGRGTIRAECSARWNVCLWCVQAFRAAIRMLPPNLIGDLSAILRTSGSRTFRVIFARMLVPWLRAGSVPFGASPWPRPSR